MLASNPNLPNLFFFSLTGIREKPIPFANVTPPLTKLKSGYILLTKLALTSENAEYAKKEYDFLILKYLLPIKLIEDCTLSA